MAGKLGILAKGPGTTRDILERKVVHRDEGGGHRGTGWKGRRREKPRDQGEQLLRLVDQRDMESGENRSPAEEYQTFRQLGRVQAELERQL